MESVKNRSSFIYAGSLASACLGMTLLGCAHVDAGADYERVRQRVSEATGQEAMYAPEAEDAVDDQVANMLADGLTVDEAVQVCLLNNPKLQAVCMDVGMARADLVQSGLLSNPSLGVAIQFPSGGGLANVEAGLAQNIADLWQIPSRKHAASHNLDRAIIELAGHAATLAAEAKTAYYEAVGAQQLYEISLENQDIVRQLSDLALARQRAGAGDALDVNLARGLAVEAELAVETTRLTAAEAHRELARILGLTTQADDLVLSDPLPTTPVMFDNPETLVEMARLRRLDIQAAKQALAAADAQFRLEWAEVFPNVSLGLALERAERKRQGGRDVLADTARASIANGGLTAPEIQPRSERDRDTDFIIGPSLDLELPIFDQNQAQIAKARYAYLQAAKTLEGIDRAVVQEVRGAADQAITAWRLVRLYQEQTIPLSQSSLELSRESYKAGRTSFLSVLESQRFFLNARSKQVEVMQAAALAIPKLESTIGAPFGEITTVADDDTRDEKEDVP